MAKKCQLYLVKSPKITNPTNPFFFYLNDGLQFFSFSSFLLSTQYIARIKLIVTDIFPKHPLPTLNIGTTLEKNKNFTLASCFILKNRTFRRPTKCAAVVWY